MTGFSPQVMLAVVLLFAAPLQAQAQGEPNAKTATKTQTQAKAQTQTQRFPPFDPERFFMLGDADLDGRLSLGEYRDFLRSSPRMQRRDRDN